MTTAGPGDNTYLTDDQVDNWLDSIIGDSPVPATNLPDSQTTGLPLDDPIDV